MTRRLKRTTDYELTLQIKEDGFLRPPRDGQRNWFLNRVLKEAAEEIEHLHQEAPNMVAGADQLQSVADRTQAVLDDDEIMEDWQVPMMDAMARAVTANGGDILEIGFGRGVGSELIQRGDIASHTVIECNDSIVDRYHQWRARHPGVDIRLLHGLWQDVLQDAGEFDGIFFHTYPLDEAEFVDTVLKASTFAENFFEVAARHLRPGGVFTYLTIEADSLSRAHQRALMQQFSSVRLSMVRDLDVPQDTRDSHWSQDMIHVVATK